MIIGVPREIKDREQRVALTPAGAHALASADHRVLIEAAPVSGVASPMKNTLRLAQRDWRSRRSGSRRN